MHKIAKALFPLVCAQLIFFSTLCYGDEQELFGVIAEPDALIAFDLSGSMGATPWGDYVYSNAQSGGNCTGDKAYGTSQPGYTIRCGHNNYVCAAESDSGCIGPYVKANVDRNDNFVSCPRGYVDCRRATIARKAIFSLLDDDGNGQLQKKDQDNLGVRMAYMRFKYCDREDSVLSPDYKSGCNILKHEFKSLGTNNYYRDVYDMVERDINEGFWGWTPLRSQLKEAKAYLDDHKKTDPYKNCRKKFVIFITDGWDTLACNHCKSCDEKVTKSYSYMRRRATIKTAKEVADAGYKVFVIGFGADMPQTERYTLEWAAYFAGTDNPLVENSGDTKAISIVDNPCKEETEACGQDHSNCTKAPNDPGYKPLTGYAFLATNAKALNDALRKAMDKVKDARYSFSVPSVSAARVQTVENDQNYIYEASFIPFVGSDPFWQGHLRKYRIDDSGNVVKPAVADAGEILRNKTGRSMYTFLGGAIRPFDASISPTYFGYSDDEAGRKARDAVVGYVRGDSEYNKEGWKLGDIFHSNPITIDPPSLYFNDSRSPSAYHTFRENNKNREWIVVVGANDGQFHAFSASTLDEKWSFIPPNLLPKLKLIAHSTEPAPAWMSHQFFVDGPVSASEVWLGSGSGLNKSSSDWRTLLIFGLGRGVRDPERNGDPYYLWSSSPNCDSGFSRKYNPPHQHYCGYYAFDVTNTSATRPQFMWRINVKNLKEGRHLDEPWSKMAIGRVMIGGNEKWVGFFGGGYNVKTQYDDDDVQTRGKRGKGFFVADLTNGDIIWSYTKEDDANMDYPIPAPATIMDWDGDGFIDTAYIADLGGNMWRFRFCSQADRSTCNTGNWRASRLFDSSGAVAPVFTKPSVAMDTSGQLWVFWGTGDKENPNQPGVQNRFFALREKDFSSTYNIVNLEKLTDKTYTGGKDGWYIELASGEKMLSGLTVFGGMVLFTTYTPAAASQDPCLTGVGVGKLYALAMMPRVIDGVTYNAGAGLMSKPGEGGARFITLGPGIPTAPVVSQKPRGKPGPTDVYVTVSGGGGTEAVLTAIGKKEGADSKDLPFLELLKKTPPQAQVIHWRDRRIQ